METNRNPVEVVLPMFPRVPYSLISEEISGIYGSALLANISKILGYYDVYDNGAKFTAEGTNGDYQAADLRFKQAASLINKEARFLFSKHPDIWVTVPYDKENATDQQREQVKQQSSIYQSYVDAVIEKTRFFSKLLKAAKDCFIGGRVAYFINFNEETGKIHIDFTPAMEFIYDTDPEDSTVLTKIICFYTTVNSDAKSEQRIYKKKYWMQDGLCWIYEGLYDGLGNLVEDITPERTTKFTYIPAGVVINDGLTGDMEGQSEIANLMENESYYSKLANADMDSERKGMNPIRWTRDMDPNSTKQLPTGPGAFWDLATDQNADGVTGEVGVLETTMNYTNALTTTLNRIRSNMYDQAEVPDVSAEALKGVVSSGKTLQAIYWPLIVRCDEKMHEWRPAITHIVETLLDGARLYPGAAAPYLDGDTLPDTEVNIEVDNQYPIPTDEAEEKQVDLAEVNAQTMSKASYMKKWRGLTDAEAMQELEQIAHERQLLEDSFTMPPVDTSDMDDASASQRASQASQAGMQQTTQNDAQDASEGQTEE